MENGTGIIDDIDDARWRAVSVRDRTQDGDFVYAVSSTGIYCKPSCPSRRPHRARVSFFANPTEAKAAGFRACKRCRPDASASDPTGTAVERACRHIEAAETAPTLEELSTVSGLSPHYLQRTFKRIVGVSPKQYWDAVRQRRLKDALSQGEPVAAAIYGAGFGSPSRVYESAGRRLGMSPASYAKGGRGARVAFTVAASSFGRVLVAATAQGIAAVALGDDDRVLERDLRRILPEAAIERDDGALGDRVAAVLACIEDGSTRSLALDVHATAFQWQVWCRLAAIPRGETRHYADIAAELGRPKAARAVARACASNPIAVVIPCHRIVPSAGGIGGYRWGPERKKALLETEKKRPTATIQKRRAQS